MPATVVLFLIRLVEGLEEGVFHSFFRDGRGGAVAGEDVYAAVKTEEFREDALHEGGVVAAWEVTAADATGKERVAAEKNLPLVSLMARHRASISFFRVAPIVAFL